MLVAVAGRVQKTAHMVLKALNPISAETLSGNREVLSAAAENRLIDLELAWRLVSEAGNSPGLSNPFSMLAVGSIEIAAQRGELDGHFRAIATADEAVRIYRLMLEIAQAAGIPAEIVDIAGPLALGIQVRAKIIAYLSDRLSIPNHLRSGLIEPAEKWRDMAFRELCHDEGAK